MGGWTSPYLAQLTADDSPLPLNLDEASWVASLLNLGRLVGAIPGTISVHYLGSRRTLVLICFPFIVSWVSLILADSVVWLYAARFTNGLSTGMAFSSFPLFLGEISSREIRGALVTLATNGLPFGFLAGNLIGAYVSIPVFAYISLVPTVICIVIFLGLPESPHYLVHIGDMEEAKKSIARYNPGIDVVSEVNSLENFIRTSQSASFCEKLKEFNVPQNRKAGFVVVMLYFFMQVGGVNSVIFYMEMILTDGRLTLIPPATMVIVAGTVGILGGIVAVYLADKFGRRQLMIASSFGVGLSMAMLGVHFTILEGYFDLDGLQWLLISSIICYEAFVCIGLIPVPNIVLSELFSPNIKSMAACMGSISIGLCAFISTKTYQPLMDLMGEAYVFWLYGIFMVIAIIFCLTMMPETKGKSLQEIQNILHGNKTLQQDDNTQTENSRKDIFVL